jgi:hypothetical protein
VLWLVSVANVNEAIECRAKKKKKILPERVDVK